MQTISLINNEKEYKKNILNFNLNYSLDLRNYNLKKYLTHINQYGLEITWNNILNYVIKNGENEFLNIENFGELYEAGLAEEDKHSKKKSGQYYTPKDVSKLMSEWLYELDGENICDVGCGTGNLILSYFEIIGKKETQKLLKEGKIYLYDFDKIALKIAKYSIAFLYGMEYLDKINSIYGDFLDEGITLPKNAKIISNPPYGKLFSEFKTTIQKDTKELYAAFMEKIINSGNKAVIITPYSFLGGSKFFSLRKLTNNYNGFIVSFDNVPGNIFKGKKHGIFNSNTANSVRAAITVVENKSNIYGFKTTHLIRFKNEEREKLLQSSDTIKLFLSKNRQIINENNKIYAKCHIKLEKCFYKWKLKSSITLGKFISKNGNYKLYMPNTCRYFTTASKRKLKRSGYIELSVNEIDKFNFLYCLINSSFVYWWWRIYDGGITYPKSLLNNVPIFYDLLNNEDKEFLSKITKEMINNEEKYITTKINAGKIQENIKFPKKYRDIINQKFLNILDCKNSINDFDLVHNNFCFN
jgi:predicted RNA methylase